MERTADSYESELKCYFNKILSIGKALDQTMKDVISTIQLLDLPSNYTTTPFSLDECLKRGHDFNTALSEAQARMDSTL